VQDGLSGLKLTTKDGNHCLDDGQIQSVLFCQLGGGWSSGNT